MLVHWTKKGDIKLNPELWRGMISHDNDGTPRAELRKRFCEVKGTYADALIIVRVPKTDDASDPSIEMSLNGKAVMSHGKFAEMQEAISEALFKVLGEVSRKFTHPEP